MDTVTKRPKSGAWVVPPSEAKGKYVHTEFGIVPLSDIFSEKLLRPDQRMGRKKFIIKIR